MLKRLFSFLLVIVMVFGMLPAVAFAQEENANPTKVINAVFGTPYYEDSTLDMSGSTRDKWFLTGKLSDTVSFGAMYQGGWLYFGIDAVTSTISVELNGVDVTNTVGGGQSPHTEIWVNYTKAGLPAIPHDYVTTLKLTVDGMVWEGLICFSTSSWLHLYGGTPKVWSCSGDYNGGSNPDAKGVFNFYTNKNGASNESTNYVYLTMGGNSQALTEGVSTLEFDLQVDKMPQYDLSNLVKTENPGYLFPGLNMGIMHDRTAGTGYVMSITRINGYMENYDGLYLVIASGTNPVILPLGKNLGESFHLRLEYATANAGLTVYRDDVLLAALENVAKASGYSPEGYGVGVNTVCWVKGADNVALGEVNLTISRMIYGVLDKPILDTITPASLLGNNQSADSITESLVLPQSVSSAKCGTAYLTWTSSDPSRMSNAGVPVEGASGEVTMTAALRDFPEIKRDFTFTVDLAQMEVEENTKVINAIFGTPNYGDNTIDLTGATRDKWQMTGKLSDSVSFGAMYQGGWLYFGIDAATTSIAVELNGVDITSTVGGGKSPNTEVWVDYRKAGLPVIPHDYVTTLKLTVDGMVWEGLIRFSSAGWLHLAAGSPATWNCNSAFNGGSNPNNAGVFNFYTNKGGTATETFQYVYAKMGGSTQAMTEGTSVLEFDLCVDKMPQYDISNLSQSAAPHYLFPGLNLGVMHDKKTVNGQTVAAGYALAVSRIKDRDGLYLIIGSGTDPVLLPLDKDLEETFHLRLEYTMDATDGIGGDLAVYCDETFLGTFTDVADARGYVTGGYGVGVTMIAWVQGAENIGLGETNFTASRMIYGVLEKPILDTIDPDSLLGSNQNADSITAKLNLPATVSSDKCGVADLVWTSSNTNIMGNDGTPVPEATGAVTMTVALRDFPAIKRTFTFFVAGAKIDMDALLAIEGVTVDGVADELSWVNWTLVSGRNADMPKGSLAAAWDRGHLYLLLVSDNTESLVLQVGDVSATVDIANETVTGITGGKVAKQGNVVEIELPMAALNIQLTDYNDAITMDGKLVNSFGNSNLYMDKMYFTGDVAGMRALSNTNSGWAFDVDTYHFEHINDEAPHYIYATGNQFSKTETTYITQDLFFEDMPAVDPMYIDGLSTRGYYFYASRNSDNYAVEGKGDIMFVAIYHNGDGKLKAKILKNESEPNAIVDLGVSLKEQFRLTTAWAADGSLKLYVNGSLVGQSNGSCTYRRTGCGDNTLSFRYYGTGTDDMVLFQLKNVTVVKETYSNVKAEMTPAAALNRADLERVTDDLPMGNIFSSRFIGDLPISWATSDPSVVEEDGTVHRGETNKTCTISLIFDGETLWSKEVIVLAASETEQPSATRYTTAYANDVVINGDLLGENWHMANKLLNGNGHLVGEMGAAWNLDNLFVAVRNNGESISLKVNGVAIDLTQVTTASKGAYTEIAIPMDYINTVITGYGVELDVEVQVGQGKYQGTLVLVGTDWWGTENAQEALPILDGYAKSAAAGTDAPDGNQGVVEVPNGWHMYDRYNANGSNPALVRSYVLYYRTAPYENFNKREGTTTVEFDFQALNMPVYNVSDTVTHNPDAFACYGVSWILADASNAQKYSNVVACGIYYGENGLNLVLRGPKQVILPLNKELGDLFRITMNWNTDNSLDIYIDGVWFTTVDNMGQWVSSVGDSSFVLNMMRNPDRPTSAADTMDVYVTNLAFGSAYADSMLNILSWDTIRGENTDIKAVTADLNLPAQLVNEQLGTVYPITWTSSEPAVVDPVTGKVTQPETGAVSVKLTATLADGSSKSFTLIVIGKAIVTGDVLVVRNDTNPAIGKGSPVETILFTFDTDNNSVIVDLKESKQVNLVTLTDLDAFARINRESMTLWISDDNVTYTQIEDYKLTQVGKHWYLYDFQAQGRYVKAHYTHWQGDEADFIAPINTIITAGWNESLVLPEDAVRIQAPVTTLRDQAVAIELPEGISTENLRIYLDGEILFHYVDKNGTVFVRIPDPIEGVMRLWNGNDLELANKENVYEVTYGTRETYKLDVNNPPRWLLNIKAGTYGEHVLEEDLLIATSSTSIYAGNVLMSRDQGLTWEILGKLSAEAKNACVGNGAVGDSGDGGWLFDDETGTIYYICHNVKQFDSAWVNSDAVNVVIASYDMGKTWELVQVIEPDVVDGNTYTYMLSYSGGIKVSSYDGEGPGVDFVFPTGAQCANNGSFCSRVAYSADGGKTWVMSKTIINYGECRGDESGLSEAWVAENDSGVLVLYTRCQYEEAVNFAQVYSYDFGVTWTPCETREEWEAIKDTQPNEIVAKTSSIYSSNTQALMYDYTQYNGIDAPLFFWGGNNTIGGLSYIRSPMNVAVSYDGLDTWRNIQNLFSETYLERYNGDGRSLVTNHSVTKVGEDTMLLTFVQNRASYRLGMRVTDFENYLYRTKGVYDDFESGNPHYEGWSAEIGLVENTDKLASEGNQSMFVPKKSILTRSVPYLQNGTVTLDVYVTAETAVTFALQPAFGKDPNAYTVATFRVENMKLTNGSTSIDLKEGWNTVEIQLELTGGKAWFSANGSEAALVNLNMEVGDYVCYFTVFNDTDTYIDEFLVVSDLDAEIYTGEVQEPAELPGFSGFLILNETIDLNLVIPAGVETEGNVVSVKFADGSDADYKIVDTIYGAAIQYSVLSNQMTKEITVQIFDADGNPLTKALTTSVRGYVQKLLPYCQTDTEKALMIRMLDYGALAQLYADINETDLANSIVDQTLRDFVNGYDMGTPEAYTATAASTGGVFQANLTLNESVVMNIVTNQSYIGENEKLVVKLDGVELADGKYELVTSANGTIRVSYSFHADKMNQELTVAIVDETSGDVRIETTLSIRKYAHLCMDAYKDYNPTLCAMMVAMLDYGALAQKYASTATDDLANRYVSEAQRAMLTGYPWPVG